MTKNRHDARPAHAQEKAPRGFTNEGEKRAINADSISLTLTTTKSEPRIDTRLLAQNLGVKHKNALELLRSHLPDFQELGKVPFQTRPLPSGQSEKVALLNEDQSYLLLSYSRNTPRVRHLKLNLVKAFRDARRALDTRTLEYLPAYHLLHDAIKDQAAGSPNERFLHLNANRAINRLAGIEAGQRPTAGPLTQSLLAVGTALAARAVMEADDGHGLQERIKTALRPLEGALMLEVKHA